MIHLKLVFLVRSKTDITLPPTQLSSRRNRLICLAYCSYDNMLGNYLREPGWKAGCIGPTCWPGRRNFARPPQANPTTLSVFFFPNRNPGHALFIQVFRQLTAVFFFSFRGSRSIEVCRILTHENGPKGCASHDRCSIRSETTETARQIIYS